MSGLDKMKAQILEEAESSAQEILKKAEAEAGALMKAAADEAEARAAAVVEKENRKAEESVKRAQSFMDMQKKQSVLAAKQEVIREVLDAAYAQIMDLDEERYFAMLGKMLEKYILPGEGTIYFSKRDLERMPDGFQEKIKTAAAAKNAQITLSEKPEEIEGGFLLVYGGIEENCTIKAVFNSRREELSDKVNRLLFG